MIFNFVENFKNLKTQNAFASAKQIHDEIYLSGDRLVELLQEQINNYTEPTREPSLTERAQILKDCGFNNHPDLISFNEAEEKAFAERKLINEKKNDLILIEKFHSIYPNHKIVRHEDLQIICKKYGLQEAPVEHFIGDLPNKNLKEIANFFKDEPNEFAYNAFRRWSGIIQQCPFSIWEEEEQERKKIERQRVADPRFSFFQLIDYVLYKKELLICCLSKDLKKDWKQVEKMKELIKEDPIVFVRHGKFAIILSAWGAEAEDVKQF